MFLLNIIPACFEIPLNFYASMRAPPQVPISRIISALRKIQYFEISHFKLRSYKIDIFIMPN